MSDNIAIRVDEWLEKSLEEQEIIELEKTVTQQLEILDKSGNGLGLIFVLAPSFNEKDGEETVLDVPDVNFVVTSYPVAKIRHNWYIVSEDGLSDIVGGVVRLFANLK